MKTSAAQVLIRGMVKEGQLAYSKENGLTLTEKASGLSLETLCEVSTEQVSRIGQEFDPLFPSRKRIASLHRSGVSVDALRAMLDELEGKKPETDTEEDAEGGTDAEDNQGKLSVQGETADPGTGGGVPIEGHSTEGIGQVRGSNGASDNIQQTGPGTIGRTPRRTGSGESAGGTV